MSMTTLEMIEKIEKSIAPVDAKILDAEINWAKQQHANVSEFLQKTKENKDAAKLSGKRPSRISPDKLVKLAGGKSWLKLFSTKPAEEIPGIIKKYQMDYAKQRSSKLQSRLDILGVTSASDITVTRDPDGIHGTIRVNSDSGDKILSVASAVGRRGHKELPRLRIMIREK